MPRLTRPQVTDPELRAALDRVGPHIENFNENLDHISNDIRAIEQYLTSSGVRLYASVRIGWTEEFTDGDYDVLKNYSGGIDRDEQQIVWAPADGECDRWRLTYRTVRRHGEIEIVERIAIAGPTFTGDPEVLENRPLIKPGENEASGTQVFGELVEKVGRWSNTPRWQTTNRPRKSLVSWRCVMTISEFAVHRDNRPCKSCGAVGVVTQYPNNNGLLVCVPIATRSGHGDRSCTEAECAQATSPPTAAGRRDAGFDLEEVRRSVRALLGAEVLLVALYIGRHVHHVAP